MKTKISKEKKERVVKPYKIQMLFNGLTVKKSTDDLDKAFTELAPEILYTEVYVIVKKGNEVSERKLNLKQGRNLFINDSFREVFINNLLLA